MANVIFSYRSKKNRANLEVRLTYEQGDKRKSQYTRIRKEVSKDFWADYLKNTSFKDADKKNLKTELDSDLSKLKKHILNKFDEVVEIRVGWLKETVNDYYVPKANIKAPNGLLDYWNFFMNLKEDELKAKWRNWQKWNEIKNKVIRFEADTGKHYQIKEINESFKKEWISWCKSQNYAAATIKGCLTYIKIICNHAKTKGIKVSSEISTLKTNLESEKLPKVYLSFGEIEQLKTLKKLPESLENAKDWLIISCYTGQRVSDFMHFDKSMVRKSKGKLFIDLEQKKTGKDISVPLMPDVIEILEKRNGNFPRPISDQRYNDYIKEVCRQAGIDTEMKGKVATQIKINGKNATRKITDTYKKWQLVASHIGRRSFATNYYGKMPTTYLKNITGHSTEAMLLVYIGKTPNETAYDAYDLMINVNIKQ